MLRARVRSISVPPTFHIAILNRHTPKFDIFTLVQGLIFQKWLDVREAFKYLEFRIFPATGVKFFQSTRACICTDIRKYVPGANSVKDQNDAFGPTTTCFFVFFLVDGPLLY